MRQLDTGAEMRSFLKEGILSLQQKAPSAAACEKLAQRVTVLRDQCLDYLLNGDDSGARIAVALDTLARVLPWARVTLADGGQTGEIAILDQLGAAVQAAQGAPVGNPLRASPRLARRGPGIGGRFPRGDVVHEPGLAVAAVE